MKKILLSVLFAGALFANIQVDTTYAALGEITKKVGGNHVDVVVLASSKYDPHFIVPKPSLLARLRNADLLVINGGGLEIGWLPPLIKSANNANIQAGAKGFLDISHFLTLMDKPTSVSRGFGDIHADGNPHYITDPHLVPTIAKVIAKKLSMIDEANADAYAANLDKFLKEWNVYLKTLDAKMATCKDKKVVQYHELFNYFLRAYGFKNYGDLEPLPGISPSSKHTLEIINTIDKNGVKTILQDVYHEKKTADFIAAKTGAKVALIPHDLKALEGTDTLEEFYNTIASRLCR